MEPAVELTPQALAIEPLRAPWYQNLATYLVGLNRLYEAEWAVRRAIELQPGASGNYWALTIIEVQRGDAQSAVAAAQQEPPGVWQDTALALARQIGGDRSAADAALRKLIDEDASISAYQIAQTYALRNDAKATFEWLDRAWTNRDSGIQYLLYNPLILRYKDEPRSAARSACQRQRRSRHTRRNGTFLHDRAKNSVVSSSRELAHRVQHRTATQLIGRSDAGTFCNEWPGASPALRA